MDYADELKYQYDEKLQIICNMILLNEKENFIKEGKSKLESIKEEGHDSSEINQKSEKTKK
jgi:hypothetical protein